MVYAEADPFRNSQRNVMNNLVWFAAQHEAEGQGWGNKQALKAPGAGARRV